MHICPVCGYDRLTEPPLNFSICPSCGTEFEYDDAFSTHAQLRAAWLRGGAKWWSPVDPQPPNWDPYSQVNMAIEPLAGPILWKLIWQSIERHDAIKHPLSTASSGIERLTATQTQHRPSMLEMLGKPAQQMYTAQPPA